MSEELRAWLDEARSQLHDITPGLESTVFERSAWVAEYGDALIAKVEELAGALQSLMAEARNALRAPGGGEDA